MEVKFYDLNINRNNRYYDYYAYEQNLSAQNPIFTITLDRDIIPNQPFYINNNLPSEYIRATYITYDIKSKNNTGAYSIIHCAAFIDSVELLATYTNPANTNLKNNSFRVNHTMDYWYYALANGFPIDFHGSLQRAHVNDILKINGIKNKPILYNTTSTRETPISSYSLETNIVDMCDIGGLYVKEGDNYVLNKNYTFLYIFMNQPLNVDLVPQKIFDYYQNEYNPYNATPISSQGKTFVFLLDKISGYVYSISETTPSAYSIPIRLNEITNSHITSMCISDLFIENANAFNFEIVTETFNDTTKIYAKISPNTSNNRPKPSKSYSFEYVNLIEPNRNLPYPMSYCNYFANPGYGVFSAKIERGLPDFVGFNNDSVVEEQTTYESYLENGIIKFNSSTYKPFSINDNDLDTIKLKSNFAEVYLSADLSNFYLKLNSDYYNNLPIVISNNSMFTPDTVLDYWTRLNAKQTSLAARQVMIGGAGQIASGMVRAVTSITNPLSSALQPNSKGISPSQSMTMLSGANQVVGAVGNELAAVQSIASGITTIQQGMVMQEIANKQKIDGNIKSDSQSSAYLQMIPTQKVYLSYTSYKETKQVLTDLHRYGYNTFLQIDEVYNNHQREHFNYFLAADIEVTGCPSEVAQDIAQMFLSGVHLWSRDIGEFENGTNYQIGVWNNV